MALRYIRHAIKASTSLGLIFGLNSISHRNIKEKSCLPNNPEIEKINTLAKRIGIKRSISVIEDESYSGDHCTCNGSSLNPIVYIPSGGHNIPTGLYAHELMHIKHNDTYTFLYLNAAAIYTLLCAKFIHMPAICMLYVMASFSYKYYAEWRADKKSIAYLSDEEIIYMTYSHCKHHHKIDRYLHNRNVSFLNKIKYIIDPHPRSITRAHMFYNEFVRRKTSIHVDYFMFIDNEIVTANEDLCKAMTNIHTSLCKSDPVIFTCINKMIFIVETMIIELYHHNIQIGKYDIKNPTVKL